MPSYFGRKCCQKNETIAPSNRALFLCFSKFAYWFETSTPTPTIYRWAYTEDSHSSSSVSCVAIGTLYWLPCVWKLGIRFWLETMIFVDVAHLRYVHCVLKLNFFILIDIWSGWIRTFRWILNMNVIWINLLVVTIVICSSIFLKKVWIKIGTLICLWVLSSFFLYFSIISFIRVFSF